MQIIFRATTATSCAAGGAITTGNVQLLPAWAPPIEYVGTTDPWHVLFLAGTSHAAVGGFGVLGSGAIRARKVRAYGRKTTLYSGKECFAAAAHVNQQYGSARPLMMYVLTYRAIGELVRP